jgi:UDP-N-acetylmuramoyl-L-alanyl-D-glutamate--2,6-diaminopimelate ligase
LRLSDLINGDRARLDRTLGALAASGALDRDIVGVTADSRQVRPGFLFAALPGTRHDGRAFIAEAVTRGAVAVLAPAMTRPAAGVPMIQDDNPRRRLALIAARFHGRQPRAIAAVTGTNGKTSTTEFTRQIWAASGHAAASLGTLGVTTAEGRTGGGLTTPDPIALHALLADLAGRGIEHVAMEASSHGLDQCRLDGVAVTAAAFTNLSRDHLDYHGSEDDYLDAKAGLFQRILGDGGTAVLNRDEPAFERLDAITGVRGLATISYGRHERADFRLAGQAPTAAGQDLDLVLQGRRFRIHLPLIGIFQAENALAALGLAVATGIDLEAGVGALERLGGVAGRLERVGAHVSGAAVFVDYAHTPDALETVLRAMRPHVSGRLHVVFGCGGDRDRGKRPLMGRACAEHADVVVLTDDNPRTEDAAEIRRQARAGCPDAIEIGDRADAIAAAIAGLAPGDALVIAGKGHEPGQVVGTEVRPFDDADVARKALAAHGGAT